MKNFYLSLCALFLISCHQHQSTSPIKTLLIQPTKLHKTLNFSGIIRPIHQSALTSPADGVIDVVHYHYGQQVQKNAIVFTLNSTDFQKRYNDIVTEYLKAKDSYTMAKAKFIGTEELWEAGLLSKNNYLSEKSSLNTERVSLMQATRKVSELFEKMGQDNSTDEELAGLSFSEFDKVHLALMSKHNLIHLKAPRQGILLYPPKNENNKDNELTVGSSVKTGQVLALVGDMRGIRIDIDVPEIDITAIQQGMPAIVQGIAFDKQTLLGKLVAIHAQASHKNNSALPSFNAIVEVNNLDEIAQHLIKVGMSATVKLRTQSQNKILVPIKALTQKQGKTWINLQFPSGKTERRLVTTGRVYGERVVIETGLKAGDSIYYEE